MKETAIVVGAGILGMAVARALAARGTRVTVLERYERQVGASIRNFGMVWPIGVTNGVAYERALRSRAIWLDYLQAAGVWHDACGSLHVAHADDEWEVLQQYAEANRTIRPCRILDRDAALTLSPGLVAHGLRGALFNADELLVDPREAIPRLPALLAERHGVEFRWRTPVTQVAPHAAWSGKTKYEADRIYICSGPEFEQLYPEIFAAAPLTRCKLQMLRLVAQPAGFKLGPALCGGLSLAHYAGFAAAANVEPLRARLRAEYGDLLDLGIHVMAAQNGHGEITTGDSHVYAHTQDPFNEEAINAKMLDYLVRFAHIPDLRIAQRWIGIYPKLTDGSGEFVVEAEPGVTIVNAPGGGGLGMTLSFGLAEELISGAHRVRSAAQLRIL
jgi:FAD dependent oxidoreductase TIGR03364